MKLKTKIAYAIFPPYVWSVLLQEVKFTRLRWMSHVLPQLRQRIGNMLVTSLYILAVVKELCRVG